MDDDRGVLEARTSRRGLFRLGAASLLALVGAGTGAADDGDGESNGQLVFIYDDSWREDWTQTFPVHQEEGVPACCAAVTEYVDTGWGLLPEHLHEMESEGWEIISHTASHGVVGNLYLTAPAEPDDERLSVDGSFLADHEGEPVVVGDEDGTVENAIAGGGQDDGFYLDIDGRSSSKSEIEAFYDQVAAGNYLGIVVGHSQFDETTEERVRFAIREAKARDLEIVTLREALSEHGVGPDEMLGTEEDDEGDDDPEVENGDDEVPTNESVSDSSDDDAGSTVRENGPAIAAGTGLLATVVVAGRAAYRRLVD